MILVDSTVDRFLATETVHVFFQKRPTRVPEMTSMSFEVILPILFNDNVYFKFRQYDIAMTR